MRDWTTWLHGQYGQHGQLGTVQYVLAQQHVKRGGPLRSTCHVYRVIGQWKQTLCGLDVDPEVPAWHDLRAGLSPQHLDGVTCGMCRRLARGLATAPTEDIE